MINSVLPMWAVGPYGRPPPHGFRRVIIVTLRVWLNVYRDILALSERSPFRQLWIDVCVNIYLFFYD